MVVICLLGFLGCVGFAIISEGDERQKKQRAHRGGLKNQEIGFFFCRWTQQQQMDYMAQAPTEEKR